MHSHYKLIEPATSVYNVHKRLRCHQPVVHTLACSEDFPIHVVYVHYLTRKCSNLNDTAAYKVFLSLSLIVNLKLVNLDFMKCNQGVSLQQHNRRDKQCQLSYY